MQDQGQRRRACAEPTPSTYVCLLAAYIIMQEDVASFATILLQLFTLLGFIDSVMHNNRKDEAREMRSSQNMHCYRDTTSLLLRFLFYFLSDNF